MHSYERHSPSIIFQNPSPTPPGWRCSGGHPGAASRVRGAPSRTCRHSSMMTRSDRRSRRSRESVRVVADRLELDLGRDLGTERRRPSAQVTGGPAKVGLRAGTRERRGARALPASGLRGDAGPVVRSRGASGASRTTAAWMIAQSASSARADGGAKRRNGARQAIPAHRPLPRDLQGRTCIRWSAPGKNRTCAPGSGDRRGSAQPCGFPVSVVSGMV